MSVIFILPLCVVELRTAKQGNDLKLVTESIVSCTRAKNTFNEQRTEVRSQDSGCGACPKRTLRFRQFSLKVKMRRRPADGNSSGHIMRKEPNNDCRTALTWTSEGRRKLGRPRTTWRRTAEREREKAGWKNWSEVQIAAADRAG